MSPGDGEALLDYVRRNPGHSWDYLADKVGLDHRSARLLLEELHRRGFVSGERDEIRVTGEAIPESFHFETGSDALPRGSPVVVDELERRMLEFRRTLQKLDQKIRTYAHKPVGGLIEEYQARLSGWVEVHKERDAMKETVQTLEEDLDFMREGDGIIRIQDGMGYVLESDFAEFRAVYVASHSEVKPISLNTPMIPVPFSLSMIQKAAVLHASGATQPRILKEPEVPAAIQQKHLRDIEELPAFLDYADKMKVRYSESKSDLYQYCGGLMQEYAPTAMFLAESLLPPDMFYTDMAIEYRRRVHLHCMKEAVSLADSSKIFNCPIAQSSRTHSQRHRRTSVWTRLMMGLTLDDPSQYIRLTSRNYDELIYSRLSADGEIAPLFTLNAHHAYLGKTGREKAQDNFGDEVTKGSSFDAYERMLRRLQTTLAFVNYKGRGLRLRFFSSPLTEEDEKEWAVRLCRIGYQNALDAEVEGLAYISGVETAVGTAKTQSDEMLGAIIGRLSASAQAPR
jgi:hypothetical protein